MLFFAYLVLLVVFGASRKKPSSIQTVYQADYYHPYNREGAQLVIELAPLQSHHTPTTGVQTTGVQVELPLLQECHECDFSRLPTNPIPSAPPLAQNNSTANDSILKSCPPESPGLKERIETLEVSVEVMLKKIAQLPSKGK